MDLQVGVPRCHGMGGGRRACRAACGGPLVASTASVAHMGAGLRVKLRQGVRLGVAGRAPPAAAGV